MFFVVGGRQLNLPHAGFSGRVHAPFATPIHAAFILSDCNWFLLKPLYVPFGIQPISSRSGLRCLTKTSEFEYLCRGYEDGKPLMKEAKEQWLQIACEDDSENRYRVRRLVDREGSFPGWIQTLHKRAEQAPAVAKKNQSDNCHGLAELPADLQKDISDRVKNAKIETP